MMGHSATLAAGAGTFRVLSRTPLTKPCTESPSEPISTTVGTPISKMPPNTSRVAAIPCFPPILRASI